MSGTTTYANGRRVAALLAVAVLALAGCSSQGDPEESAASSGASPDAPGASEGTTPSADEQTVATPGPDSPAVPAPGEVSEETEEGVEEYVEDLGDVLADPSTEEEIAPETVTGAALEDLRNQVAEYEASGWRVVGEPRVVRHRVVRYHETPETAVVRACIDNSRVRVVDADGRAVPGSRPASPRTLNVLTLVKVDGDWAVAERRLAARPDC